MSVEFAGRGDRPAAEAVFAQRQASVTLKLKRSPQHTDAVPLVVERTATWRSLHARMIELFGGNVGSTRLRWFGEDDFMSKVPRLVADPKQTIKVRCIFTTCCTASC